MDYFQIKKAQYYVWYLGWKEVRCLWGREFTEPITKELVSLRAKKDLPKLTIEVGPKRLKIYQLVEKKKKVDKIKYPSIPSCNITYVTQALSPDEDVVSCIFVGFNPQTQCMAHVHSYKCDSPHSAEMLTHHLSRIVHLSSHMERSMQMERDLVRKGQVVSRPSALVGYSDDESSIASTIDDSFSDFSLQSGMSKAGTNSVDIYDTVAAELKNRLNDKVKGDPILYPYKDYLDRDFESIAPDYLEEDYPQKNYENTKSLYSSGSSNNTPTNSKRASGTSSNGSPNNYPDSGISEMHAVVPRWKMGQSSYKEPHSSSKNKSKARLSDYANSPSRTEINTNERHDNFLRTQTKPLENKYLSASQIYNKTSASSQHSPTNSQSSQNYKEYNKIRKEEVEQMYRSNNNIPPALFYDDSVPQSKTKNPRMYSSQAIIEHRPLPGKR